MGFSFLINLLLVFLLGVRRAIARDLSFDKNYIVRYGYDHVSNFHRGLEVQLSLDLASGAGFKSKQGYGSGFFQMMIKVPENRSPGVVTTFYLTSNPDNQPGNHDEIDFEFLGTDGPPFVLQTNLYANDTGGREQRIHLWFDPTKHFHKYAILWNHHQIVFFVDENPIRVHKNTKKYGGGYPTLPMYVEGSIWNGEEWASGGKKVDWSKAPFRASYRGFGVNGCINGDKCHSAKFWWNRRPHWGLTRVQRESYENIQRKYLFHDYCKLDTAGAFKECHIN